MRGTRSGRIPTRGRKNINVLRCLRGKRTGVRWVAFDPEENRIQCLQGLQGLEECKITRETRVRRKVVLLGKRAGVRQTPSIAEGDKRICFQSVQGSESGFILKRSREDRTVLLRRKRARTSHFSGQRERNWGKGVLRMQITKERAVE